MGFGHTFGLTFIKPNINSLTFFNLCLYIGITLFNIPHVHSHPTTVMRMSFYFIYIYIILNLTCTSINTHSMTIRD